MLRNLRCYHEIAPTQTPLQVPQLVLHKFVSAIVQRIRYHKQVFFWESKLRNAICGYLLLCPPLIPLHRRRQQKAQRLGRPMRRGVGPVQPNNVTILVHDSKEIIRLLCPQRDSYQPQKCRRYEEGVILRHHGPNVQEQEKLHTTQRRPPPGI